MNLSNLKNFFDERITGQELSNLLSNEIADYKRLLLKKGASVPIIVQGNTVIQISKRYASVLCEAFINDHITLFELMYIVDVLQLSEPITFESEELLDFVSILTDPEVNGEITKETAQEVLQYCNS